MANVVKYESSEVSSRIFRLPTMNVIYTKFHSTQIEVKSEFPAKNINDLTFDVLLQVSTNRCCLSNKIKW